MKIEGDEKAIERSVTELHRPYWLAISQIARHQHRALDLLPVGFFSHLKHIVQKFNPLAGSSAASPDWILGHFPSSQNAFPVQSNDVLLLHLFSDFASVFMFWDTGEATFFINEDDLPDRNFDQAWAIIQG